jgi:hypothetical protein
MKSVLIVPLVAVWALFLAPSACALDVLAHVCPCPEESACGHESECEADPCNIPVVMNSAVAQENASGACDEPAATPPGTSFAAAKVLRLQTDAEDPRLFIPLLAVPTPSLPLLC